MTYAELKTALQIFGYNERDQLTLAQVKRRHRELVKSSHPDLAGDFDTRHIQMINAAAAIIMEYLHTYRFSFSEEEFYRQNTEERLRMQFSNDPVWGGG